MIPVLTFYELLQSKPSIGRDEAARDLSNLRNRATMRAYWADYSLLLRRVAQSAGRAHRGDPRRARPVGIPGAGARDEARTVVRRAPDRAAQQARPPRAARLAPEHLGDRRGPHLLQARPPRTWTRSPQSRRRSTSRCTRTSTWSSTTSPTETRASTSTSRTTRDTWWGPADFVRHDEYIAGFTRRTHEAVVLWQLPVGDTRLNDTWDHYRDNRLQWWLDNPAGSHLKATPQRRRDRSAVRRRR